MRTRSFAICGLAYLVAFGVACATALAIAFGNPDWQMLASAFGWHGHYITKSEDLAASLEAAFNEDGPSLVVIPIDYRENPLLTKKLGQITHAIG